MHVPQVGATDWLQALAAALGRQGLNVLRSVSAHAFDGTQALHLASLLPDAGSGLLVGAGGGDFFGRFLLSPEASDGERDPLDRYTRRVVSDAGRQALGAAPHRIVYPFVDADPALPFQAVARAGGAPPPGPLGIVVHPTFGPWWAWRAFIVLPFAVAPDEARSPWPDACAGCPAPCIGACPVSAPAREGFSWPRCRARRHAEHGAPDCVSSCEARRACVVAPQHAYALAQLAFHMRASLDAP